MVLSSDGREGSLLPLELWDKVIDFVAGGTGYLSRPRKPDVIACCLVCRAFAPRCRFYLYQEFTLRSGTQLKQVDHVLSNSPILCNCLYRLIIDAGNGVDQLWVSTVPFSLPLSISSLDTLVLRGVDLSVLHPEFQKAFSRIRIDKVRLDDVRHWSYTQVTRFFSVANTVWAHGHPAMTDEVVALRRLPPRQTRQWFAFSSSWATLGSMTRELDLLTCTGEWKISFNIQGSSSHETSVPALANIRRGFEQICGQPDRKWDYKIQLYRESCNLYLQW